MVDGIDSASKALQNGLNNMSIVANNLANINTTGFKRDMPFAEMLDAAGEVYYEQYTDHRQGDTVYTNNPLDLALDGDAFFTIQSGNGVSFTRNGNFKISNDGYLVTETGEKVLGQNGEISFGEFSLDKERDIKITRSGEIFVGKNSIDELMISKVNNLENLKKVEGSSFILEAGDYSQAEPEEFKISQGYLESSNVNPVIEMEAMIQMSKDYESATKMVQAIDTSLQQANEIGKI